VLIDFQARGLIDDGGDLDGLLSANEPRAERGAVPKVVEQRPSTRCALIEPTRVFLRGGRLFLQFICAVVKRSAISPAMMILQHLADHSFIHESLGRHCTLHPTQRPIDREKLVLRHRGDHRIRFGERGRKRFLDEHMNAVRRHELDVFTMPRRSGAEDDHIRL
jgi:hypothetical protein